MLDGIRKILSGKRTGNKKKKSTKPKRSKTTKTAKKPKPTTSKKPNKPKSPKPRKKNKSAPNYSSNVRTGRVLSREFYARDPEVVAKDLLGKVLVHMTSAGTSKGMIVETEAYYGRDDPASHAYRGKTPRSGIMWDSPGTTYVYFTYGMHNLLNIVTEPKGIPSAVLIRAVEPVEGTALMKKRRKRNGAKSDRDLTNGPGKVTQAFGITTQHNGMDVTKKRTLYVLDNKKRILKRDIIAGSRIGISAGKDMMLRFYVKGNKFVSKA